jgi:hypothetical protein
MTCHHEPICPNREAADATAAHIVADHCEQGWFLLCNGLILFDDGGSLGQCLTELGANGTATAA